MKIYSLYFNPSKPILVGYQLSNFQRNTFLILEALARNGIKIEKVTTQTRPWAITIADDWFWQYLKFMAIISGDAHYCLILIYDDFQIGIGLSRPICEPIYFSSRRIEKT